MRKVSFEELSDWGTTDESLPVVGIIEGNRKSCPWCRETTDIPDELKKAGPWLAQVRGFTKQVEPKGLLDCMLTFECSNCRNLFRDNATKEEVVKFYDLIRDWPKL